MYILDFIPIILAFIAIFVSGKRILSVRRKLDYFICTLSVIAAILLIFAQTSWWVSYVIDGNLLGTMFANKIWFMFNTITMLILILSNKTRKLK